MANEISRRAFIKGLAAGAVSVATVGALTGLEHKNEIVEEVVEATATPIPTPEPTPAPTPAPVPVSAEPIYTPGTYEATAKGISSDVKVTMTFDEYSITDVQIDVSGETPGIGAAIGDEMAGKLVSAQSCEIDGVAGASITSDAIKAAAADCISQASGAEVVVAEEAPAAEPTDWLGTAPEIDEADITEECETEVLVVGCGTGGWIATMTAAEEGAKVMVVESREAPTNIRHDIGAIGSKLQQETYKTFPEYEIDKIEALQDIVRYGSGYVDSDLVKVWEDNSGELVDWLTGILEASGLWGMAHEAGVGNTEEHARDKAYATGHSPFATEANKDNIGTDAVFQAYCDEMGVEFKLSTAMIKLEQDDSGKVTGIIAKDLTDEHYIRIKATKGVIMCAGSYTTNTDMLKALQPQTLDMKINLPAGSTCDGSGIKAMLWAGGYLDTCHAPMLFNRACCLPTETAGYKTNGKMFWFGEQPFLKVNLNGKRFCNESGPYEFMLHSAWMQPYHTYCDIFDSNSKQYCEQFDEVGCCRLFPFNNGALSNRDFDSVWAQMVDGENSMVAQGYIVKADTLEELAEGLNIPVDNFVKTVERYNELVANGVDEDYGKEKHRLTPVDAAPFYGVRTGAWHLTTMGGCRINTDMQVIREDGTPIEGLWATGDCTGGFFANNYPNLFTGLACGRTMTFGRRAAKIVANL